MKTIRTKWRDELLKDVPDEQYQNPLEVRDSPLGGVIACIAIAFLAVVAIICLVAFSVYLAETIVKLF